MERATPMLPVGVIPSLLLLPETGTAGSSGGKGCRKTASLAGFPSTPVPSALQGALVSAMSVSCESPLCPGSELMHSKGSVVQPWQTCGRLQGRCFSLHQAPSDLIMQGQDAAVVCYSFGVTMQKARRWACQFLG